VDQKDKEFPNVESVN